MLIVLDGVFFVLKDGEIVCECMEYMGFDMCVDGIVEKVLKVCGIYDDIIVICVDISLFGELEEWFRVIEFVIGEVYLYMWIEKKWEFFMRE